MCNQIYNKWIYQFKIKELCTNTIKITSFSIFMLTLFFIFSLFASHSVFADDFYVYPKKDQSKEQMEKDKYTCYQWAKNETGFDPMAIPVATSQAPQQTKKGGALRGAAGGAIVGGAVGSIDGNFGDGAAKGAVAGGLIGGMRRASSSNQQQKSQQQWEQEQAAIYAQKRDGYNRAYAACLESKDYTVK